MTMMSAWDRAVVNQARGGADLLKDCIEAGPLPAGEPSHQKHRSDGGGHDEADQHAVFKQSGGGSVFPETQSAMHQNLHCESPRNVRLKPGTQLI